MPRRSKHPGVKIVKRTRADGTVDYYARFREPFVGKWRDVNLARRNCTSAIQRQRWCEAKSKELARQLDGGATRAMTWAEAVDHYMAACDATLRPNTINAYRADVRRLVAWLSQRGATLPVHLRADMLYAWRASTLEARPSTINTKLARAKAALTHWRRLGVLSLSSDEIADSLRRVRSPQDPPRCLSRGEIKQLLAAVEAHDSACFDLTREGYTDEPRHESSRLLVWLLLLTGMRLSEALTLTWPQVDLLSTQHGTIHLTSATKNKKARTVDLAVCPSLSRELLRSKTRSDYVLGAHWHRSGVPKRMLARLRDDYDAPACTWKDLRSTCASYLVNAPGIWGAASAYRTARQLGHSVEVSERHYMGLVNVPRKAATLEEAMSIRTFSVAEHGHTRTDEDK